MNPARGRAQAKSAQTKATPGQIKPHSALKQLSLVAALYKVKLSRNST